MKLSNPQQSACNYDEGRSPAKADTGSQCTALRSPGPKSPPRPDPHKGESLWHEPLRTDTRLSEINAAYIQKPIIPGIECVGEIADPSDSGLKPGQRVAALMGGMGRSFNGSYAQYVLAPASHVFAIDSDLPWEKLAAIPETYFTAWGSLFQGLKLDPATPC